MSEKLRFCIRDRLKPVHYHLLKLIRSAIWQVLHLVMETAQEEEVAWNEIRRMRCMFKSAELALFKFMLNLFNLMDKPIIKMECMTSCARNSSARIEDLFQRPDNVVTELIGCHRVFNPPLSISISRWNSTEVF
jgi:hypothetical protein